MGRPTFEDKAPYGGLTKRQFETLKFIVNYSAEHPYPPTLREIGSHLGVSSSAVLEWVVALEKAGYITRDDRIPRGIWITSKIEELSL